MNCGYLEEHLGDFGMNRKILVTGGTGFVGSHVIASLLKNKDVPILLKRSFSNTWRIKEFIKDIVAYDIDTTPLSDVFAKEDIDGVINLAAYYIRNNSYDDTYKLIETNLAFPTKLLELSKLNDVPIFVNAGSYFQYASNAYHIDENSPLLARNLYAATKNSLERIMEYYSSHSECKTINLILFTPYGRKDNEKKLIPYIINRAINNESVDLTSGFQRLNMVYVGDIANAFVKSLDLKKDKTQNNLRVNIASKESYSIRELVSVIEDILGRKIDARWGKIEMDEMDRNQSLVIDTEVSAKVLKWKPKFSIYDGLKETIKYYKGDK
jgi:nucleoside-diphosphate-sugar epimerase